MKLFFSEDHSIAYNMDNELFDILSATDIIQPIDNRTYTITNDYRTYMNLMSYIDLLNVIKKQNILVHQLKSLVKQLLKAGELTFKQGESKCDTTQQLQRNM